MTYTNLANLPEVLAEAIQVDHYHDPSDKPSDYSVTNLISPIQQTELVARHKNDTDFPVPDVLDGFNAWVGSVIHNSIEDAWKESMDSIVEERFYMEIEGKVLSGKVDCLDIKNRKIIDWKTCKLYKVQKGDYRAWEEQANLYAMLAEHNGYKVESLEIVAIMLDWKATEAKFKKGYPEKPVATIKLNCWSQDQRLAYAKERILLRKLAEKMEETEICKLIPCTREDQWSSYKGCAMVKEGNSKATKVFENKEEAQAYVKDNPKYAEYNLVERYSVRTRCNDYCSAKKYCQQYKDELQKETGISTQKLKI